MSAWAIAGWVVLAVYAGGVGLGLYHFRELSKPVPFDGVEMTDKQRAELTDYQRLTANLPPAGVALFQAGVSLCWPLLLLMRD